MDQSEVEKNPIPSVPSPAASLIAFWRKRSNEDANRFRTKWRRRDLQRASPDIAVRLHEQENLFVEACVTGIHQDIETHGAALCRGWMAACKVMEGMNTWVENEKGTARSGRNEPWER